LTLFFPKKQPIKYKKKPGKNSRRHICHFWLFVETLCPIDNVKMEENTAIDVQALFSKNLKRLRTAASISQLTLASQAELTHNFINDIENGKKWVSAKTIGKLATALQAEPYQFFLSESLWSDQGTEIFSTYLRDFTRSFEKMVKEYRQRYIPNDMDD
jgi:transcriptional regulator with XRE-family HTH domain